MKLTYIIFYYGTSGNGYVSADNEPTHNVDDCEKYATLKKCQKAILTIQPSWTHSILSPFPYRVETQNKKTSIYLTEETRKLLRCPPRGPTEAVNIIANRYNYIIQPEKKRLAELFTQNEWNAMRNACNGTAWESWSIRYGIFHAIHDSLESEITYFQASKEELERKLASLSIVQQYALVEAIEEYWESV